jgi:hypothetical protein
MADRTQLEDAGILAEAAAGPARSFFISYASHDADVAQKACSALEAAGFSCWMAPRDVKPGAQYADAIVLAINEAQAVVLVLSASAVAFACRQGNRARRFPSTSRSSHFGSMRHP